MKMLKHLIPSVLLLVLGCSRPPSSSEPTSIRLVDLFGTAMVQGATSTEVIARSEWKFTDSQGEEEVRWQVGGGVREFRYADGALRGQSASPSPVLHLEWSPPPAQQDDHIHSVEVRIQSSSGGEIAFATSGGEDLELGPFLAPGNPFAWSMSSPVIAGEEASLYSLRPVRPLPAESVRHILLRPASGAGVEFAIESVRVVFEREHLSSLPSGVGWQGLSGIFRESLVSRSPETLSFEIELPADPVLDMAVGTLEPGEATFEVRIEPLAGGGEGRSVSHTVASPQSWEEFPVALGDYGGSRVTLSLSVESERAGALGLWGAPAVRSKAPSHAERPQGVIVVLIDTLRRDHLEIYGYDRETAPLLARLAAEGVLVEDPLAQATWTKVSVPSIFTSLYPTSHTVADLPDLLPASATTMAEVFRDAGFATFGLSAIPFTGKMTNLHQGYEVFSESSLDLGTGGVPEKAARPHVDQLLPWLEDHREVPFFVFLHVEDPHSPYVAPPPYATLWGGEGDAEKYGQMQDKARPAIENPIMRQFGMATTSALVSAEIDPAEYVRYELDAYDGLIRFTDAQIERIVEKLEELGLSERVLLAFVSDHGTEFLEHDWHFHGQSVYGELNRVPMFFWGQGVPVGVRVPGTVETIDFMPTLLEIAGLEIPAAAQGQSLVPWFEAGGDVATAGSAGWRRKPAITEKAAMAVRGVQSFASTSIVLDGWKLVRNVDPRPGLPELELFDHGGDPLNLVNVAEEHADRVQGLVEQLDRWQEFAEAAKLKSDSELASSMSAEELERLRSLGYL